MMATAAAVSCAYMLATLAIVLLRPPLASAWQLRLDDAEPPFVFFNHSRDACYKTDVVDETLNAFRLADGTIRMIGGNGGVGPCSWRGSTIETLTRDCETGPVIRSRNNYSSPADYPHNMWLPGTWTEDGTTVHGLVHDEFHTQSTEHPRVPASLCRQGNGKACWFSSVISVVSEDGGRTFRRVTSEKRPHGIVVAGPLRYRANAGVQGAPAHRHIVERDGWFYVMPSCAFLHIADPEVHNVKCVFRTANVSDPSSWRGWDGSAFTVPPFDPYTQTPPDKNASTPQGLNTHLTGGLNYLRTVGEFILLGTVNSGAAPWGQIVYQSSKDLLNWSDPVVLLTLTHIPGVRDGKAALYPGILDPRSQRRNFDDFGTEGYLFYLQFRCGAPTGECWERDVIRRRVTLVQ